MNWKVKERTFSGTTDPAVSEREYKNQAIARSAAAEGIVIMKNEGVLPLDKSEKIALLGGGASHTIKGGTGSGDVCERSSVTVYQGMSEAGFDIVSRSWLDDYEHIYAQAREDWKQLILDEAGKADVVSFFDIYASHAFKTPQGRKLAADDIADAKTAIYVVSRVAGEAADRFNEAGDYMLADFEKEELQFISGMVEDVIVVLNVGGQIDLKDIMAIPNLKALVLMSQAGMEGGNALADVLSGDVVPSGKLVDTWAVNYEDFPNSETFSHNNHNVEKEKYEEGIYVGYRYFESFDVAPAYPFGFGLSYTDFTIETNDIKVDGNYVAVIVTVKNTGAVYAGKEVVQVYAACPQEEIPKEYKRLVGFTKTKCLAPGESQKLEICFSAAALTSFDEEKSAWVIEKGNYGLFVGNSSADARIAGALAVAETTVMEEVAHICPLQEEITELLRPDDILDTLTAAWVSVLEAENLPVISFAPKMEIRERIAENEAGKKAAEIVEQLTDDELAYMLVGEASKSHDNMLGSAGIMVPGAAGESSSILEEKYGIPGVSMADGPAGVRIKQSYEADVENNTVYTLGFLEAFENGIFCEKVHHEGAVTFYQYCTAIPVGTMLAQTWNVDLVEEVGHAVAVELEEFGIAWWLAPGMNVHRNPLCGRNFEYYAEDPLLSGYMAAAMTRGVQTGNGVGTTIKHFACNNQEDNRMGSDSILSERTLREIYLKGFEIAVKTSQPMALMTSYNMINGVHAANNHDTCTVAAREEWDFQGLIMTDWTTTTPMGGSISWKCAQAGNDLIMPGQIRDVDIVRQALEDGGLSREDAKACVRRLIKVVLQTVSFENAVPYGAQFEKMKKTY